MSKTDLDPDRWQRLWQALGAPPPQDAFARLSELYAASGRYYHNATHILACLDAFDELRDRAAAPAQVELAIWYHDAIYDSTRQDNEARSAELAVQVLQAAGLGEQGQAVHDLIMATDHRNPVASCDQGLLVDIDLSILAAPPALYQAYTQAVRREYAQFPDVLYVPGRRAVLQKFLQRPAIFNTEQGRARWEATARSNIEAEIGELCD